MDFFGKSNYLPANQPPRVFHFFACFYRMTPIKSGQAHVLVELLISVSIQGLRGKGQFSERHFIQNSKHRQSDQTDYTNILRLCCPIFGEFNPVSWQRISLKRRPSDVRRGIIVSVKHRPLGCSPPASLLLARNRVPLEKSLLCRLSSLPNPPHHHPPPFLCMPLWLPCSLRKN